MPYCTECGIEVSEEHNYCPSCGMPLRAERVIYRTERGEKQEKGEKMDKQEKGEKYEKGEVSPVLPLVGGLILIFMGVIYYLNAFRVVVIREVWPYFIILLGLVIIVAAIYAGINASKRFPQP